MIEGLDERIREAYGVSVATATMVPKPNLPAASLVLAAEQIALAIGDVPPRPQPIVEDEWPALPAPPPAAADPAAVDKLLAWAKAAGARFDAIEIRVAPDGNRSVHAKREIKAGERVLEVPRVLITTDEDVAATPIGRAVGEAGPLESGHTAFAAWLAAERANAASPWQTYVKALPASLADIGFLRGGADLAPLAGTAARRNLRAVRATVTVDHGAIQCQPSLTKLALADFAWARAVVGSRAYKVTIGGVERRALVPLADLFDHAPVAGVTWSFDDKTSMFAVTAARAFAPGDAIHACYGGFGNPRFLAHYGFAVANNPNDDALLVFPPAGDPRHDVAAHLLWGLPLGAPTALAAMTHFDDDFRRALSLARLRASRYIELVRAADRGRFKHRELQWIDARIEADALQLIAAAARAGIARLDAHPSFDSGPSGLRSGRTEPAPAPAPAAAAPAPTSWQRTCAIVRAGERAILDQIIAFTAAAAAHVASPSVHAWRRVAEATPAEATGPDRLLREYLLAVAAELPR